MYTLQVIKKWNNILGWISFCIASFIFISTIEPNLSFWDCGEYITSSVKLEIGHAPGAATFQLLGSVMALFAFGDASKYALMINIESALCSAFTILFMFWTITHLSYKLALKINLSKKKNYILTKAQSIIIFSSSFIGSFCFMFSDTFWFSAVEGEVYAMASMFSALIIWLICKWENDINNQKSNKWLILISFFLGLSVGVHLMVLLVIPTLVLIYYYNHYKITIKNFIIAHLYILLLLIFYFKGIFPFLIYFFLYFEIFFVNTINFPFYSGIIIAFLLLIILFSFLIYFTHKNNYPTLHTITLCILYSLIGFSSWIMIVLRAHSNTPVNLNNPDNITSILDYYTRRGQYGDWPIFYGPMYTAFLDKNGIIGYNEKESTYEKDKKIGKYIKIDQYNNYKYSSNHMSFFPRMYHNKDEYINNYQIIAGKPKTYIEFDSKTKKNILRYKKPSFSQNLYFFFNYQIGYMFLRYLLWNYAGRQNDIEGNYHITEGNWKSGISFIDEYRLGTQKFLPKYLKNNKSNNTYYFLPLILGVIGILYQCRYKFSDFHALFAVFFLTSIGIHIYTNMKPFEPRERDYSLITSFYIYAIWIGIGTSGIFYIFNKIKSVWLASNLSIILFAIPLLMGYQNWDDHDRSRVFSARDLALNYLNSCDPKAILFVYGDNDTYPLWALQEIENYRDDIRVLNYSLLSTVWGIDQARRKINESPGISMSLKYEQYRKGKGDFILVIPNDTPMTIEEAMKWISEDNPKKNMIKKEYFIDQQNLNFLPTNKLILPVNKEAVIKNKIVDSENFDKIVPYIILEIPVKEGESFFLYKNDLILLNMLLNYKWDRPIYFSSGGIYNPANILFLTKYLEYTGFHYKLVPIENLNNNTELGIINSNKLYKIIKNFHWGGYKDHRSYFDSNSRKNIHSYRMIVSRAAEDLIKKGEKAKAEEIMDLVMQEIPLNLYNIDIFLANIAKNYIEINKKNKALNIINIYTENILEEIDYYLRLFHKDQHFINNKIQYIGHKYFYLINQITNGYNKIKKLNMAEKHIIKAYQQINERINDIFTYLPFIDKNLIYKEKLKILININNNILSILNNFPSKKRKEF